jgi:hypothetical protein
MVFVKSGEFQNIIARWFGVCKRNFLGSAVQKTNLAKKQRMSQTQGEQEQARDQHPQMGSDGLIGCQQKKMGRNQGRIK